ncbi:hypothetical protein [Paenibacillus sp. ALJ109b]|uniref:hypothetical protein n=1 Tax=Paenibacillus TaxID=44249 RepID=UPI0013D32DB9|nr:hypothetical protein [Paenibacillus sp. ALJ109b]NEU61477.1 hypothetical protein [Paenibacillus sp. ALJ109b]
MEVSAFENRLPHCYVLKKIYSSFFLAKKARVNVPRSATYHNKQIVSEESFDGNPCVPFGPPHDLSPQLGELGTLHYGFRS